MRPGRHKRKMRALASRRSRLIELVGCVGAVGDGNVFVDELWDVRFADPDEHGPLIEDAVFSVDEFLAGVAPRVGPLGDSMGADVIRVWGLRLENGSIRVLRVKTKSRPPLTKTARRKMRELARKLAESLRQDPMAP